MLLTLLVCKNSNDKWGADRSKGKEENDWFHLASLFNGISTFVCYLMPKPSLLKNNIDNI